MVGKLIQDSTMDIRVWKIASQATQQLKKSLLGVRNLSMTHVSHPFR